MTHRVLRNLLVAAGLALVPNAALAADIEHVETYLGQISDDRALTLCREPFYPPGECRPARFTEGVRYNWVQSSDARSNELISLIHDANRNGSTPVFHSTIPGYGPMRITEPGDEAWCMPEFSGSGTERFHARIAGFRERGNNPSGRPLARYGLYLVAESEAECEALLELGRSLLGRN